MSIDEDSRAISENDSTSDTGSLPSLKVIFHPEHKPSQTGIRKSNLRSSDYLASPQRSKNVSFKEVQIFTVPMRKKTSILRDRLATSFIILFLGNLLRNADKHTIIGVMSEVEHYFKVDRWDMIHLRSGCLLSIIIVCPLFGYCGDRYLRKLMASMSFVICCLATLMSSLLPSSMFLLFFLCRVINSVGDAGYGIVSLSLVSDLFGGNLRSLSITLFCMAMPVGSGLGYTLSKKIFLSTRNWKWSFRLSPLFSLTFSFLFWFIFDEPKRGASYGKVNPKTTPFLDDIKYILRHRTFISVTIGSACAKFVFGAMSVWGPTYVFNSSKSVDAMTSMERITVTYELLNCISGMGGVLCGFVFSSVAKKFLPEADSIVCGLGMLLSGVTLFLAVGVSRDNTRITWFFLFYSQLFMCMNISVVCDIIMYTVVPTRRSFATSAQIFLVHALGDMVGPYIVAAMLGVGIQLQCCILLLGGICFFLSSITVNSDKRDTEDWVKRGSKRGSRLLPKEFFDYQQQMAQAAAQT